MRRASWPANLVLLDPGALSDDDKQAQDWVEASWQTPTEQTDFIKPTDRGILMAQLNAKRKASAVVTGKYADNDADVIMITKAVSSNQDAAMPIITQDGKSIDILAIMPATGITITVDGYIKDADGDAHEVTGAVSNVFDIVDASTDMVPALNPDGTPQIDPVSGAQVMIPAQPSLVVFV